MIGSARPLAVRLRLFVAALLVVAGCGAPSPMASVGLVPWTAAPPERPVATLAIPGPVPDFAPMHAIATHEDLAEMAPGLLPALQRQLGRSHVVVDRRQARAYDSDPGEVDALDDTLVWKRDYQPIYVRDGYGGLTALYYLAENPNRVRAPSHHSRGIRERVMPLIHENGNLVTTGRFVFVTDQILDENADELADSHLLEHGYRAREPDDVLRVLSRHLLRPVEDIIVLPTMPYEATGHIDLFLLPLDERTVMIPQIEERALMLLSEERVQHIGQVIRIFLDEQATFLAELGLEVVRLPMIPPAIGVYPEEEEEAPDGLFELLVFSPANALLANVRGQRHVFLPGFDSVAELPELAQLARGYTATWRQAFAERGWAPHVVDASALVSYLGLFRCVTASIPQSGDDGIVEAALPRLRPRSMTTGHPAH